LIARSVPTPINIVNVPSTLTVVYARMRLRSVWPAAIAAAMSIVTAPVAVSSTCHKWLSPNTGFRRASRNTPALTIVAECR
jgi:hypothetical protein